MLIAQHLDFNVTRIGDELLEENPIVAEARFRFRARARKAVGKLGHAVRNAHALAAAARGGLDHDRVADFVRDPGRLLFVLDHAEIAGHRRDLGSGRRALALDLVAHGGDRLGVGADKDNTGLGERLGEGSPLRQKPVAGMHRFRAGFLAGGDDLLDDEVTLRGGRRSDRDRHIGHFHMQRVAVSLGIHRDRRDTHPPGGLDDPAGDLAAVGNEDLLEHAASNYSRTGPSAFAASGLKCQRRPRINRSRLIAMPAPFPSGRELASMQNFR